MFISQNTRAGLECCDATCESDSALLYALIFMFIILSIGDTFLAYFFIATPDIVDLPFDGYRDAAIYFVIIYFVYEITLMVLVCLVLPKNVTRNADNIDEQSQSITVSDTITV